MVIVLVGCVLVYWIIGFNFGCLIVHILTYGFVDLELFACGWLVLTDDPLEVWLCVFVLCSGCFIRVGYLFAF